MRLLGTAIKYDILRNEQCELIADREFYNLIIHDLRDVTNRAEIIVNSVENNYLELLAAFFDYETELSELFWNSLKDSSVACFKKVATQPTLAQNLLCLLPDVFEHAKSITRLADFQPPNGFAIRTTVTDYANHLLSSSKNKKNFWVLSFYAHLNPKLDDCFLEALPEDQQRMIKETCVLDTK